MFIFDSLIKSLPKIYFTEEESFIKVGKGPNTNEDDTVHAELIPATREAEESMTRVVIERNDIIAGEIVLACTWTMSQDSG